MADYVDQLILKVIEQHKERAEQLTEKIYARPEKGFYEENTTNVFADYLESLGLQVKKNIARTGCISQIKFGDGGPHIAIMAELDALRCRNHPDADENGYAHCCGHYLQEGAVYLIAAVLQELKQAEHLSGTVDIIGVPAEEYIDIDVREQLKNKGEIRYYSGKQELIFKGYFDHTDIVLMTHNMPEDSMGGRDVLIGGQSIGFRAKKATFIGKESHAGASPWDGINALQAIMLAFNNINAIRDTFKESDQIRVHSILTQGGDTVNSVPAMTSLEMHVRSTNMSMLQTISEKINHCLQAGALAVGCDLKIQEIPGYFPGEQYENINKLCWDVCDRCLGEERVGVGAVAGGASDLGDISQLCTTLKIYTGGVVGKLHSKDFRLTDFERACMLPAQIISAIVYDLTKNNGMLGTQIREANRHNLTTDQYQEALLQCEKETYYHYM